MKKEYLLAPGPTPVPPQALSVMGKPIFHHRTPRYRKVFQEVTEGLQKVFQTKNDVLTFSTSGTGAMEASVCNLLSAGDQAIAVGGGKFGERWVQLGKAYGIRTHEIKVPYGSVVDPQDVAKALKANPAVKAVFATLCETSTGVVSDIEAIAKIVKATDAVLVVDAISGLGADDIKTDAWGVDVVVAGSQKGLMIPPGLAFASVSARAWKLAGTSKLPKYYLSFQKAKKALATWDNAFTPPVTLVLALRETLKMILEEGMEQVIARHAKLAAATRAGVQALGLELFCASPSNAVTAVKVPAGVDGTKLVKTMRDDLGVTIAGGQGEEMKGRIFRIAHLGFANAFDVLVGISATEMALARCGHKVDAGAGVRAAREKLMVGA